MQVMSIAFCLAYQTGEIVVVDKPIIIKNMVIDKTVYFVSD
ncbi:hypothetical protein REISMN_02735 [Rickettsia tamurae subsp. buchneri]|uniref:Uncharacterized protein n=1 Tax=Rickettsia tamurae subsp. buchneri TaxID=1462938 RepID=A0A8E1C0A4_9RICK|nr:hypothetical protein REISMN_02735 [Rickettsia tamurae subsp. buchneri]